MNPRHRRLLIPGLLVALGVVVVVAALAGRAGAAETPGPEQISEITDPRVTEASGMASSRSDDDLVYVINDSGNANQIFAVRPSSGEVVGTTTVGGPSWTDTEALAIDDGGRLWVADTGDNLQQRQEVALYALPEPGPGDRTVTATRYPITYPDGPADVEALMVRPGSGDKVLVTKTFGGGRYLALPDDLRTDRTNEAEPLDGTAPAATTDATYLLSGDQALIRTYGAVVVVDVDDWSVARTIATPPLAQSETISMDPGGDSFLVGSEGTPSPLVRVPVDGPPPTTPTPTPEPTPVPIDDNGDARSNQGFAGRAWAGSAVAIGTLVVIGAWVARRP